MPPFLLLAEKESGETIMEVNEMNAVHKAYQRSLLRCLERINRALEQEKYTEAKKILGELIEDTKADIT